MGSARSATTTRTKAAPPVRLSFDPQRVIESRHTRAQPNQRHERAIPVGRANNARKLGTVATDANHRLRKFGNFAHPVSSPPHHNRHFGERKLAEAAQSRSAEGSAPAPRGFPPRERSSHRSHTPLTVARQRHQRTRSTPTPYGWRFATRQTLWRPDSFRRGTA